MAEERSDLPAGLSSFFVFGRTRECLISMGILSDVNVEYTLEVLEGWHRAGAETYQLHLRISADGVLSHYVVKALLAPPGLSSSSYACAWNGRRRLLEASGVRIPKLFASRDGSLIEERISWSLWERLKSDSDEGSVGCASEKLLDDLCLYIGALRELGFAPVDPFLDLRATRDRVVPVDFGLDLGPADVGDRKRIRRWNELLRSHLHKERVRLPEAAIAALAARV